MNPGECSYALSNRNTQDNTKKWIYKNPVALAGTAIPRCDYIDQATVAERNHYIKNQKR